MARLPLAPEAIETFRARLVEAAMELTARHGFEGLTLRAVAEALGCSHTTPYRYFTGKDEIFAAVRAECFRRLCEHLEAGLAPVRGERARLRAIGRLYFEFARAQPDAFHVMFALRQGGQEWPGLNPSSLRSWGIVHQALADAVAAGVIGGDPAVRAHLLWAAIHGVAALYASRKLSLGVTADDLIDPMLDALLAAWRPDAPPAPSSEEESR